MALQLAVIVVLLGVFGPASLMKTVKECEDKMPPALKGKLCEIRKFQQFPGPDFEKHIQCVLEAVQFVTHEGKARESVMLDAFGPAESVRTDVQKCGWESSAANLYSCLLRSKSAQTVKDGLGWMEIANTDKWYGKRLTKEQAKAEINKKNAKICKKP